MSMPPTVGPNVALVLQRLDLIERKIDWLAERVTWLTYSSAASTQESSDSPDTVRSSSPSRPETTPPSIAPQTRSASEHSWQRLNESPAQAPVNDPLPEDRNVHPAKAPSADAPRATQTEVPQAQHYEPPAPVEPARSFTAQAGPTPMQYAPAAGNAPHMQATNQVGPAGAGQALGAEAQAVPGWAQRAMREGNLGRYLLSGAAAVLVL